MRPLIIGPDETARAAGVVAYAKEHPYLYEPGRPKFVPGDHPEYVAHFGTYRVVFTFTHRGGEVFRHLTVSVPSKHYPNPFATWTLAELFGFTGWDGKSMNVPKGWAADAKKDEHCIVVVQRVTQ